jgi:hypothetical protein
VFAYLLAPQTRQLHNALIHVHHPLDVLHYPYSVPLYRVQTQRIVTSYKQRLAQREVREYGLAAYEFPQQARGSRPVRLEYLYETGETLSSIKSPKS